MPCVLINVMSSLLLKAWMQPVKVEAIKRIVKNLDPREYDIHCIGAPERFEARHPYLWRFWNRINEAEKSRF